MAGGGGASRKSGAPGDSIGFVKRSIGAGERLRQALGVLILVGVAVIALGLDTRVLARLSTAQTFTFEHRLAQLLGMEEEELSTKAGGKLPVEGTLPPLDGAVQWLNSPPLTREQLRGKVVLIDFWTYSCINCIRSVPYVRAWQERYKDQGLVVIGVHSPEFAFEKDPANVRDAVADLGIRYPVALDNDLKIWSAFNNRYWPAHYLADAEGRIRYHHFGEGRTDLTEAAIRSLLAESGAGNLGATANVTAKGASAAADRASLRSPETYLGSNRAENFTSTGGLHTGEGAYRLPAELQLNQWGFAGRWKVEPQRSVLLTEGGKIVFRFRARDLHLVLGASGKPVRFRVLLDGKAPGIDHGMDIDATGNGRVERQRLYQLVRQKHPSSEREFTIEFLDAGVEAYAFTFG